MRGIRIWVAAGLLLFALVTVAIEGAVFLWSVGRWLWERDSLGLAGFVAVIGAVLVAPKKAAGAPQ